jgi:hypothetical protein
MAWVTPPTFSTDEILTAYKMGILSDDLEHLHGLISGANPAMASAVLTVDGDAFFVIRHTGRYLHGVYLCQADIKIYYDATEVYHDGAPDGVVNDSINPPIDLNTFGLTIGQLYIVKCTMDSGTVFYLYEKDTAGYV